MNKNFALIGSSGYVAPKHMQTIKNTDNNFIAALDVSDSILSIPMHPYISDDHIEFITNAVKKALG